VVLQWYFIVVCGLLSIIPAGVVVVVFVFKYVELKGDLSHLQNKVKVYEGDTLKVTCDYNALINRISDAEASAHKSQLKISSVEESFVALSNKWNSRDRVEKAANKKKEREEQEDTEDTEEKFKYDPFADPNQLTLPFIPQQQQMPLKQKTNVRKFGQMPGR